MKVHHMLAAFAAGSFALGASAQNLKPGLWEVTNKMTSASGEMEKTMADAQRQMAEMPAEQRKQIEAMMAKQGMKMGSAGAGGMSTQMCMTKEMVERNEFPVQQGDCKTTKQQRSGNTIKMAWSCANPPSSGEGQYTIVSPEAYTTKATITSTMQGKSDTMNIDSSGRWLGPDCGSIKPMRPPAAK